MTIELNREPVLAASVHFPMNGAWSAELSVASDAEHAVGDTVTLTILDQDFVARVVRAGVFADRLSIRLTGGPNDWGQPVEAKHYRNVTSGRVLSDLGLTLSTPSELALAFWTRAPGTVGMAVQSLAQYMAQNWRVLPNGQVLLTSEAPAPVEDPEAVELGRDPGRGMVQLAPERATVLPGGTFGADTIGDVVYNLSDDGVRCVYYTEGRATLRGSLERLIRWITRDTIYLTLYSATVIRQAADGTLDLLPDDLRIQSAGLQGVPIRHGLPGVTVTVPAGERVLLGFDSGDPARPYAALWHAGQVTSVQVGGSEPVALASAVEAQLAALKEAISAATPVPNDGGAALKTAILTALEGWPESTASEVLQTR